jgi:hypothetical protein
MGEALKATQGKPNKLFTKAETGKQLLEQRYVPQARKSATAFIKENWSGRGDWVKQLDPDAFTFGLGHAINMVDLPTGRKAGSGSWEGYTGRRMRKSMCRLMFDRAGSGHQPRGGLHAALVLLGHRRPRPWLATGPRQARDRLPGRSPPKRLVAGLWSGSSCVPRASLYIARIFGRPATGRRFSGVNSAFFGTLPPSTSLKLQRVSDSVDSFRLSQDACLEMV